MARDRACAFASAAALTSSGYRFALFEIKAILFVLIRSFEFTELEWKPVVQRKTAYVAVAGTVLMLTLQPRDAPTDQGPRIKGAADAAQGTSRRRVMQLHVKCTVLRGSDLKLTLLL